MEPKSNHLGYWSNAIVAAQLTCGLNGFQKPDTKRFWIHSKVNHFLIIYIFNSKISPLCADIETTQTLRLVFTR